MSTSTPSSSHVAASPMPSQSVPVLASATKPPSASLYVGDLVPEVTEGMLCELFATVGPVSSIRVCRDTLTRRSLGYAYVNFHSVVDAERALDTLNNSVVAGKPCRIMWSQRDPSVRKTGIGNIFIKNLAPTIGHKELYDTFSAFGNILSCKVALNEKGESKGYGFVHFENQSAAEGAISTVNNNLLLDKKVYVGPFIPRKVRTQQLEKSWTNVFIKDLDSGISDDELQRAFSTFGHVTSAVVMRNKVDGASLGFGFVNFADHESAASAVEQMHGEKLGNKLLYCCRAQKKAEREARLKKEWEQLKISKYQGINLYIKNLEDEIDEERLRKEFSAFGTVKSCKIMPDEKGNTKGFGFVCFSSPEESQRAITEMNSRILTGCSKPLYVALHEPKELRRQKLALSAYKNMRGAGLPHQASLGYPSTQQPVYYATNPGSAPSPLPPPQGSFVYQTHQGMMATAGMPRGWQPQYPPMHPQGAAGTTAPGVYQNTGTGVGGPRGNAATGTGAPNSTNVSGNRGGRGTGGGAGGNQPNASRNAGSGRGGAQPGGNQNRRGGATPNAGTNIHVGPPLGQPVPMMEVSALDMSLAQLKMYGPDQQKLIVGERLYPLIASSHGPLAGKITGMFLDSGWTVDELYTLLTDGTKLAEKIEDAMSVLERAQQSPGQPELQPEIAAEGQTEPLLG